MTANLTDDQQRRAMALSFVKDLWTHINHANAIMVARWIVRGDTSGSAS